MTSGIDRRVKRLEEAARNAQPKKDYAADIEQLMLAVDTDSQDDKNVGNEGNDSSSSPEFWNQRKLNRWQRHFLNVFGKPLQVIEDGKGSWHWAQHRDDGRRPDFTVLP